MKLNYYIAFFLLSTLFSCKKEVITKTMDLSAFQEITFNSSFEVVLIQGNEHKIVFEGNQKAIDKVDIQVKDSILSLKNTSKSLWLNPNKNKLKVYITFQNLKKINAIESCNISNQDTLKGEELGVFFASKLNEADLTIKYNTFYYYNNHPCGGKLTLQGNCDFLKLWNYALMQVDATNLWSNHALVDNYSKGDCSIRVTNLLEYAINGEGNITCYGNPSTILKKEESSTGKLILK